MPHIDPHIDIDSLSEEELIELNHKVLARLRFLHQMRSHSAMLGFRIGERVKFHPDGRPAVFGTLTRYNKKTVTVVTDSATARKSRPDNDGIAQFPNRVAER